jgi:hypothetical protein
LNLKISICYHPPQSKHMQPQRVGRGHTLSRVRVNFN